MNLHWLNPTRVLAIDPAPRGFGFVVLEGPTSLIDWGVKSTRKNKESETLAKVAELIQQYQPEIIVLEDYAGNESRRCRRIEHLIEAIRNLASGANVKSRSYSRSQIKQIFSAFDAVTKEQIAHIIARQLPELAPSLPWHRKPWMSEDYRMSIFDAAALALTFFYSRPRFVAGPADHSLSPQPNVHTQAGAHFSN